jgi:peptidoglycan/xylan/chitin deacetylase (PgdA/CDA1 family)
MIQSRVFVTCALVLLLSLIEVEATASPLVRRGSRGAEVTAIQTTLKDLGYHPGPIDGVFGPLTERAVKALQRDHGLLVDGLVGSNTRLALQGSPSVTPPDMYTVQAGDTLVSIAKKYGLNPIQLARNNSIRSEILYIGQALTLRPSPVKEAFMEPPPSKRVALTFNDGPFPGSTPRILDILKEREIKATFFIVGSLLEAQPGLGARIIKEGHEMGNHSYRHRSFSELDPAEVWEEIRLAQGVIDSYQSGPRYFRPPYAHVSNMVRSAAREVGVQIVLWTHLGIKDYPEPRDLENWVNILIADSQDGSVLMLHDGPTFTYRVLPLLLDGLEAQGFSVVSLSTLLGSWGLTSPPTSGQ